MAKPSVDGLPEIADIMDSMAEFFGVPKVHLAHVDDLGWYGEYIESCRWGCFPPKDTILLGAEDDICTAIHEFAHHLQEYLYFGTDTHGYTFTLALNRVTTWMNKHFPHDSGKKYTTKTFR